MMISISELQNKWDAIDPPLENYLLVSGSHPLSVHVGYNEYGRKAIVVYDVEHLCEISSSKSVESVCIELDTGKFALSFTLLDSKLKDVFTLLCWDLIDYSDSEDNALSKLIERYGMWQKLLQQYNFQSLGPTVIKGLIGELFYLDKCIDEYGEDVAVSGWVGPNGADQDFIYDDKWVEIKTTGISSDKITISSLQQLGRYGDGYLVVYFMEETSSEDPSGYSLKSMIELLENKIQSEISRDRMWTKLTMLGVRPRNDEYATPIYHVSNHNVYHINGDFPRLVRDNVPVEINSAKYTISLPAIDGHKV